MEPIRTLASITALPGEVEAIISDYLASALSIVILNSPDRPENQGYIYVRQR